MSNNNRVELSGHLGADPKVIGKDDKTFLVLRLATTDSYPVGQGEEVKWKDRETIWHDVLVFKPATAHFARDLKKGDRVQITGAISYRPFKDAEGYTAGRQISWPVSSRKFTTKSRRSYCREGMTRPWIRHWLGSKGGGEKPPFSLLECH